MTNPDNVGGLLPCPGCGKSDLDHCPANFVAVNGLTRGMIVRCAWCHFAAPEATWNRRGLCRAAPAGGEYPEAAEVCAEAYQVVGCMLMQLGLFDTPEAEKILDNLSEHRLVHKDVLPWTIGPKPLSAPAGSGEVGDEDAYVIEQMGRLLAEIAIIVNGPEPALTKWSYHDLPEKVRKLQQGADGVDWRAHYRFQTAMRYMDNNDKMTLDRAQRMADEDIVRMERAAMIAASQGQDGGKHG